MPKKIDLTGQVFGKWTVLAEAGRDSQGVVLWLCRCECGNENTVSGGNLRSGKTTKCKRCRSSKGRTTHGMKAKLPRLYQIWRGIKRRVLDPNRPNFPHYGGRGITMYKLWRDDPKDFIEYVLSLTPDGKDPGGGYHLDRIDNEGHYVPGNLRWITPRENNLNRREGLTRWLTDPFDHTVLCLTDIASKYNLTPSVLSFRLDRAHWPLTKALTTPVRKLTRKPKLTPARISALHSVWDRMAPAFIAQEEADRKEYGEPTTSELMAAA